MSLVASALQLGSTGAVADAAIAHEFLQSITTTLEEGVPTDCGGQAVPPCITGPLSGVNSLTVDSGHLWVAERIERGAKLGSSRVDRFDDTTGKFVAPQIDEQSGLNYMYEGIAVGHAGGEEQVYVSAGHEAKAVLAVFGSSGVLLPGGIWNGEHTPTKTFGSIGGIAIDDSNNMETRGDLFVATAGFNGGANVVDVYAPQASGSEPQETIGVLTGTPSGPFSRPTAVAVSPNGDVLVADGDFEACRKAEAQCRVDVFEPVSGTPGNYAFAFSIEGSPGEPFKVIKGIAVDGEGNIYAVERESNAVEQFDASGKYVTRLTGTPNSSFKDVTSVAVDPASGDVFVGDLDPTQLSGVIDVFGPSRIVPDVTTLPANGVAVDAEGHVHATLNGTVNPLNAGDATCRFVWGTTKTLGNVAPCEPEAVPNGTTPVPVKASIEEGLAPDTAYFYRLQASNANGANVGEASDDREFQTPGPGIHGEWVTEVASSSATLSAAIDPNNASTSYFFEYGRGASYEAQAPLAPGAVLGEGKGDMRVHEHVQGLVPGRVYHYRVIAESQLGVKGSLRTVSFAGPDQTFTTQTTAGAELPDGRHWELVSPPDKHGALLFLAEHISGGVSQAASDGSAVTYLTTLPVEEGVQGYVYLGVQALAVRGADGWVSRDIALPHATPPGLSVGSGQEYRAFSPDLATALVEPLGEFTSLAPEVFPPDTDRGPYVRHDSTCGSAPGSCYRPLLVVCPPPGQPCASAVQENADVPAGTDFGGNRKEYQFGAANFVGGSSSLSHAIIRSTVALTETPTGGTAELYEWSADKPPAHQLSLISMLVNEKGEEAPASKEATLGSTNGFGSSNGPRGAVSENGGRVVWSSSGHLYMRDAIEGKTLQLDLPQAQCLAKEECGDGEPSADFQLASAGVSRVFFTDQQRLTADAGQIPGNADLYECEITQTASVPQCKLTDLTPAPNGHQSAFVQGAVIGASEDGSWVYFVANGVLGDGARDGAVPGDCRLKTDLGLGSCHLYVRHEGVTHLIATLAGEDYPDWGGEAGVLKQLTARVSPNGRWLAFMSNRSLTGYDNHDAVTSKPDEEVFLYHAESSGTGDLVCASCQPSGARPSGVEYAQINDHLVGGDRIWQQETGTAANVPGWTPLNYATSLYQSRYLSNEGRLFFNTISALVPNDVNKGWDVYEYEPAYVGDCSTGSPEFQVVSAGCVALISSGGAAGESAFVDASETGNDVFFMTGGQLVGKDVDTALDLYDAHVCSAATPCAAESQTPPPCVTAESCRAAPSAQPDVFGAPSSSTFSGQGNVEPTPVIRASRPASAQRRLRKALAVCRHRYRHAKRRRLSCERRADRRYGGRKRKRSANSKRSVSSVIAGGVR